MFATQYVYISIFQFNHYNYRKFFCARFSAFRNSFFVYLFFVLLFVLGILLDSYIHELLGVFYLILQGVFLIVFYVKQFEVCELVFTKKIIRFFLVVFVFDVLILILIIKFFLIKDLSIVFCFFIPISFFCVSLSFLILLPIEKLIGFHYIKKAKTKISNHKNLIKIGITGSYAKTSVKEILGSILSENFNVLITPKSYNTPFGVTKTVNEKLNNSTEVFVCEMGAKKKGEVLELCNLVKVDRGIVTAVGHQHTDSFGGIEKVFLAKRELSDYLRNKICVFNLMNVYTRKMYNDYIGRGIGCFVCTKTKYSNNVSWVKKRIKSFIVKGVHAFKVLYSLPHKNNYYAKIVKMSEFGSVFEVYHSYTKLGSITTMLLGQHNIVNILMAIAMAIDMGVPFYKIRKSIITFKCISARHEKFVTNKGAVIINNGYNSNIDSARSSLGVLNLFQNRIKVVVTPGLVETSDDFKYNRVFGEMLGEIADEVIIVKSKNKNAIVAGLSKVCFDMSKVYFVDSFLDAKGVMDIACEDYVFLIENDLPNYYK